MKPHLLDRIRDSVLDFLGYRIERATEFSRIHDFLLTLRPVDAGVPLIRVGGIEDGGYLLPDSLEDIGAVISPGVGASSVFELHFAERNIPCILIDGTVAVEPFPHPQFTFLHKMLTPSSALPGEITLAKAVDLLDGETRNMILQMDIEGAEWDVLGSVQPDLMKRFKILVIEFHGFDKMIERKSTFDRVERVFSGLFSLFTPVHIHINNYLPARPLRAKGLRFFRNRIEVPPIVELTFLRNDLMPKTRKFAEIPHPLDMKNMPELPDVPPPHVWAYQPNS